MLFKGTTGKTSIEIVKFIEGLGGSFDAFTTKENLVIITKFLSEHFENVFNLIAEVLLQSKIAEEDLIKEKSVILEEIKSDNDDPAEYIFDLLFQNLFPSHTMGLTIAGTEKSVSGINVEKARRYYHELLKRKIVIAVSGNFEYETIVRLVRQKFASFNLVNTERTKPNEDYQKVAVQTKKEISQVHLAFSIPGIAYSSSLRHQVLILNTMFGGGMSSRLFQGLREKDGLVYDVHSFIDFYSDCGVFGYYLVCDKKNLKNAAERLAIIFDDITRNGFTKEEIDIAKTYITGNLLLSLESSTNRMLRLGRELMYLQKTSVIDEVVDLIKGIPESEINKLTKTFLDPRKYSVAAVGPINEKEIISTFSNIL